MPDHEEFESPPPDGPIEAVSSAGESGRPLRRHLERSEDGRWVLGVCTALRDAIGWPTWLLRLLFVALTPVLGLGALLYLVLAVTIPHEHDGRSILGRFTDGIDRPTQWVGAAAAILGGMMLLAVATGLRREAIIALGLLAAGILLFQVRPPAERPPRPVRSPASRQFRDNAFDDPAEAPLREARPPRPPRERSPLTALTVAATLLVLAVMSTLHFGGLVTINSVHYLAAATITVALGLLVGSRWGRSRVLVVVALGLVPFTGYAFIIDNAATAAETFYGISEVEEITVTGSDPNSLSRTAARVRIDLTGVEWQRFTPTQPFTVHARVGDITVVVPDDVIVEGRVGLGQMTEVGRWHQRGSGLHVATSGSEHPVGNAWVSTDWGTITIERSAS